MKVKVIQEFIDKNDHKRYNVDEMVEFEDNRAKELIKAELVKAEKEPK